VVAVEESGSGDGVGRGGGGGRGASASWPGPTVTGGELLSRSRAVAAALRATAVGGGGGGESGGLGGREGGGDVVGIRLPHGVAFLVAFYGVLAAGGAACPLEEAYPAAFMAQLAAGAGMSVAVAATEGEAGTCAESNGSKHGKDMNTEKGSGAWSSFPSPQLQGTFRVVLRLDPGGRLTAPLEHSPAPQPPLALGDDDWGNAGAGGWGRRAMCVTTTSGTTGTPKVRPTHATHGEEFELERISRPAAQPKSKP